MCGTLWLSCVAPCKEAPVYLEQNSKRPGKTGLNTRKGQLARIRAIHYTTLKEKHEMNSFLPVVSYVKCVEALSEALHVVGTDFLKEIDVVLRVEPAHVMLRGFVRLENLQRFVNIN